MKERLFINQLKNGMNVDQVFLVREKDLRTARTGDLYITCTLCDKTGSLPARMWQASESIFNAIVPEGFLQVKGRVEDYRGSLQMVIDACRPWASGNVQLEQFLPVTPHDIEGMWTSMLEILRDIKDPQLRRLIKKFLEDRELVGEFKRAPAAMQMHHAYIGGLLEHTLSIARCAKALLPLYPQLNADLVLCGVFLHDIGKCRELSAGTTVTYTDSGMLIGHIAMAVLMIAEKAAVLAAETSEPIPPRTLELLQHLVLSHHGTHEFGSPKLPCIPEAFFLHHLDNLDAKVWMTSHAIANDADAAASFTTYHKALETRIYKKSGQLQ